MFDWNSLISSLPDPHFLQTHEWGQVKSKYGWSPLYAVWTSDGGFSIFTETDQCTLPAAPCTAAALILKRQVLNKGFASRLSVLYAPKGPLLDWSDEPLRNRVLNDLQSFAKKQGAIFLKMDPDVVLGTGIPGGEAEIVDPEGKQIMHDLEHRGWKYSSDQIQFRNTVLIESDSLRR